MDRKWNMSRIYASFQSEEIRNDKIELKECAEAFRKLGSGLADGPPADSMRRFLELYNRSDMLAGRIYSFANLSLATDTGNIEAQKLQDEIRRISADMTAPKVKFQAWLKSIEDFDSVISSDPYLSEHKFILTEMRMDAEHALSEEAEDILVRMRGVGSSAWTQLQNNVTSRLTVNVRIDGEDKKVPLSQVRNFAFDRRREVRRNAYEAEIKAYSNIENSSAAAINAIKGEGIILAEKRGFKSPLDMTLFNSRLDIETLDAMMEAVNDSLSVFTKYFLKKSSLLNNPGPLPFYDLLAPISADEKGYSYDEAASFIVDRFSTFSEKLSAFAENAFKMDWIDPFPYEGKRGGAFCSGIHAIRESRVLSNFSGSFKNVTTLAHELGHAYHNYNLFTETPLNASYTMPVAETASIFCETIVMNAAIKESSGSFRTSLLETSISSSAQVVVDILSRFIFEKRVFERRKSGPLSVEELCTIMESAQKEAYGDGLDHRVLHRYMWANKPHYYYADAHFYNFPYTFGLLFAKGLYARYEADGDAFVEMFDSLLKDTGKYSIPDLAMKYGIDIRDRSFWDRSLSMIGEEIKVFCNL